MNNAQIVRKQLIEYAESYGTIKFGIGYAHPTELKNSSIIFNDISYNFHHDSYVNIIKNPASFQRTQKKHTKVQTRNAGILEMQSSNSSDALAMNIFCHPDFPTWLAVRELFKVADIYSIVFGYKAEVHKLVEGKLKKDKTEVDIFINDCIIVECKLTESDFSSKIKTIVEQYSDFNKVFEIKDLQQTETHYINYQLIRNILAAAERDCRFILICDIRRPDLAHRFNKTVSCVKDNKVRAKCEIIYWQDLAKVVGDDLKFFLKEKYGIEYN